MEPEDSDDLTQRSGGDSESFDELKDRGEEVGESGSEHKSASGENGEEATGQEQQTSEGGEQQTGDEDGGDSTSSSETLSALTERHIGSSGDDVSSSRDSFHVPRELRSDSQDFEPEYAEHFPHMAEFYHKLRAHGKAMDKFYGPQLTNKLIGLDSSELLEKDLQKELYDNEPTTDPFDETLSSNQEFGSSESDDSVLKQLIDNQAPLPDGASPSGSDDQSVLKAQRNKQTRKQYKQLLKQMESQDFFSLDKKIQIMHIIFMKRNVQNLAHLIHYITVHFSNVNKVLNQSCWQPTT